MSEMKVFEFAGKTYECPRELWPTCSHCGKDCVWGYALYLGDAEVCPECYNSRAIEGEPKFFIDDGVYKIRVYGQKLAVIEEPGTPCPR